MYENIVHDNNIYNSFNSFPSRMRHLYCNSGIIVNSGFALIYVISSGKVCVLWEMCVHVMVWLIQCIFS